MTELEKMIAGELYNAEVPDLQAMRTRAAQLCHQLEQLSPTEGEARLALLKELLGKTGEHLTINHGFKCDYGSNITVGEHFYANYNLVVLDCAPVVFGENVFIAPNCGFYTAGHPLDAPTRNSGLEFASGIPGTLGGAMYMNAGAYKSDISACLKEVCVCRDHTLVWMKKEELDYAYRHSAFQSHPEWTIIAGKLQLSKSCQKEIRSLMDARRERRLSSQPLDLPNCGSVFRNPPQHPAWQLIEEIGYRGRKIGGAMVSDKHANFIVNVGSAKAKDVDQLIQEIQEKISEQYGIDLITEVERFNWNS